MAGKEAHITNKPTGSIVAYNSSDDKYYVLKCDTEGVLTTKGEIDATIDFEVGHGKTLALVDFDISAATTTEIIAAAGAGIKTYVYGYLFTSVSSTINAITLKDDTTVLFQVDLQSVGDATAGFQQIVGPDGYIFESTANKAINLTTSAAVKVKGYLLYWQE
jgi:hypothetical protein